MTTTDPAPRVLIVEDEFLLVMLLEDLLPTLGYTVVGSAGSVEHALAKLDTADVDLAVVDVNLAGEPSFPVADALRARRAVPVHHRLRPAGPAGTFRRCGGAGQTVPPPGHPERPGRLAPGGLIPGRRRAASVGGVRFAVHVVHAQPPRQRVQSAQYRRTQVHGRVVVHLRP